MYYEKLLNEQKNIGLTRVISFTSGKGGVGKTNSLINIGLALDPSLAQKIISNISATSEKFTELGYNPVILTTSYIRAGMSNFVERFVPGVSVISHQEIAPNTRVQSLGVINME